MHSYGGNNTIEKLVGVPTNRVQYLRRKRFDCSIDFLTFPLRAFDERVPHWPSGLIVCPQSSHFSRPKFGVQESQVVKPLNLTYMNASAQRARRKEVKKLSLKCSSDVSIGRNEVEREGGGRGEKETDTAVSTVRARAHGENPLFSTCFVPACLLAPPQPPPPLSLFSFF